MADPGTKMQPLQVPGKWVKKRPFSFNNSIIRYTSEAKFVQNKYLIDGVGRET